MLEMISVTMIPDDIEDPPGPRWLIADLRKHLVRWVGEELAGKVFLIQWGRVYG